jgi:hypothetical protein
MRRLIPFLLGLAALSSFFVAQSGAQTPTTTKPAPGCGGVAATDKENDSTQANLEITRLWFNRANGKTTANVEVKKLDKKVPSGATSISWYVTWDTDATHFVSANTDGGGVTYSYGDLVGTTYSENGSTSGQFFDGDKGVIAITVPNDIGGKVGSKLTGPYAKATENTDTGILNLLSTDDSAPDEGGGKDYTVTECTTTDTPTVSALNVKAASTLKAKGKAASVKLTGTATAITGTLKKGTKKVGSGKLAALAGKGTLKLKLSKKLKKGSYKLTLAGTNADGTTGTRTSTVKLK